MFKETEIKLRVSPETLLALRDHPLLKKRNKSGWQEHPLYNQYYDTPARDLASAKVALRLRRDGDQIIQTFKSRGQSIAGLSERHEWDWYLEQPELDVSRLDDSCWPAALAELDKSLLQPLFTTDFVRQRAEIAWGRGKAKVVIEAALDLGKVLAGEGEEDICELELELRQGEPEALLELAEALAADLPLMPCDISKAERGYRLFDANSYSLGLSTPELSAETSLDDSLTTLGWHLLGSSQRLAEQYRFNGHWRLLVDWVAQLVDLRALLGSLGQAAPRSTSSALRQTLDALLQHWRPIVQAGQLDDAVRKAAPAQFAEELTLTRWGQFSLGTSSWLLARRWTVERNNRGNRQGAAPLGNWLPTLIAEEGAALQLKRYQQQPEDLSEQLPRLERLLVWLRLARPVLDVAETDRLYGEMCKLSELAQQPRDAEVLAARQAQAHTVATLKAWRQLVK